MPFLTGFKYKIDAVRGNPMVQLGERVPGKSLSTL
jgi:hypothetical protein